MIKFRYILPFILTLSLSSCISSYDFEPDSFEIFLVVDGKITQKNTPHEMLLSYSSSSGKAIGTPVEGATILLYDLHNNFEQYIEIERGRYIFFGNTLKREAGNSYYIEITLLSGKKYKSMPQKMPYLIKANEVQYKIETETELNDYGNTIKTNYVNLYINTPLTVDNEKGYFLWRVDEAYSVTELFCHPLKEPWICYVKRKVEEDKIKIFSAEDLEGGILSDYKVGSIEIETDWEFFEKHFYNVAQHVISKEAYDYWNTVQMIATPTGSIFDVPPAPIKGNIFNVNDPDETVLGFFEVSMVDTVRTKTWNSTDFERFAITDLCSGVGYRRNPPVCCNCLELKDSDLERPYYWGD